MRKWNNQKVAALKNPDAKQFYNINVQDLLAGFYGESTQLKPLFEFQADSNMNDLIAEYQQYEEAGLDDAIYDEGEYEELVDFSSDASNKI